MEFDFIKQTRIFTIVGIFIPGFTALGLLELQILLSNVGIDCQMAWIVIWTTTTIAGVILPILFYLHITRLTPNGFRTLKTRLAIFNSLEYIFIQSSLMPFFTNTKTLCYGHGGQNGIELIFTAWTALPCLIALSFIFNKAFKSTNRDAQE